VRQQRPADDLHQGARQPVVRSQEPPSLAIEAGQRAVSVGEIAGNDGRQALGGGERVGDPAGGQRIAGLRGVAEQHGARREPGPCATGDPGAAGRRRERRGALQDLAQEWPRRDPAIERRACAAAQRLFVPRPATSSSPSGSGAA